MSFDVSPQFLSSFSGVIIINEGAKELLRFPFDLNIYSDDLISFHYWSQPDLRTPYYPKPSSSTKVVIIHKRPSWKDRRHYLCRLALLYSCFNQTPKFKVCIEGLLNPLMFQKNPVIEKICEYSAFLDD